jgi:hypothetical protein
MTTRNFSFIVHPALGGLDVTKAPTLLEHNQLTVAENIEYYTSGSRKKRLGTAKYNGAAVGSAFTDLEDFWRYGVSLIPTQKFMAHTGTSIVKDDGDGVWDVLDGAWGSPDAQTDITIAQGYAVFATTHGDVAKKYDQTALSDLTSTGTPKFSASTYHQRRLFTAGETEALSGSANPSRTTFSAAGDITDFSGADTGSLIFDQDDGDRLMGISDSYRGRLYFFKGPQYGAVFELTGTSPSTYANNRLFSGAPCVSHQGIITLPNDIYWASRYGFHSLAATQKFGDTEEANISRPVQALFNRLNHGRLHQIVGFYHPSRNIIGWTAPESGQTQNNVVFVYNYLLQQWSTWRFTFPVATAAVMLDPAGASQGQPRLYLGGYDGYVREGDQEVLADDGTQGYAAIVVTPIYSRFSDSVTELHEKQFYAVTTFFNPKGQHVANLEVLIDKRTQSAAVEMVGGGAVLDTFVLDVDRLAGNEYDYVETIIEDRGRSIQLSWTQAGVNQDMEIYGHAVRAAVAEGHAMEPS